MISDHQFGEGFAIMKYVSEDGSLMEWLWNSRNGVTPFCIAPVSGPVRIDSGQLLQHEDWEEDVKVPNYVPPIGMRIFVDLTLDRARAKRIKYVEERWDAGEMPIKDHPFLGPMGKARAARYLAKEDFGDGGQPEIITVDGAIQQQFLKRALEAWRLTRDVKLATLKMRGAQA